jgi:transposase-like protein
MIFPLTESVKLDLANVHRGSKQKHIADKIKSIQLIGKGYAQNEIAEILDVCEKTVYNWKQEFINSKDIYEFAIPKENQYGGKLDDEKKTSL